MNSKDLERSLNDYYNIALEIGTYESMHNFLDNVLYKIQNNIRSLQLFNCINSKEYGKIISVLFSYYLKATNKLVDLTTTNGEQVTTI